MIETMRKRQLAEQMRQRATDLPERLAAFVRRDAALLDFEADAIERRAGVGTAARQPGLSAARPAQSR
jgi:hypothetical protein